MRDVGFKICIRCLHYQWPLEPSKEVGLKTLSAAFERRGHHLETQHCKVDATGRFDDWRW